MHIERHLADPARLAPAVVAAVADDGPVSDGVATVTSTAPRGRRRAMGATHGAFVGLVGGLGLALGSTAGASEATLNQR